MTCTWTSTGNEHLDEYSDEPAIKKPREQTEKHTDEVTGTDNEKSEHGPGQRVSQRGTNTKGYYLTRLENRVIYLLRHIG